MNIQNVLIGIAIGDAFGAGVEFQDRNWIRENIDFSQFVNVRDRIKVPAEKIKLFVENYTAWDYTDDTEMTIGLIKALISEDIFSESLLVQKWEEEYNEGKAIKGYGRNGHGSMSWYFNCQMSIEEVRRFQKERSNPGNAPATRSIPLGFLPERLINKYSCINAMATHPNENAIISSQCIARATEFLVVKKGDKSNVIAYIRETVDLNLEYNIYFNAIDELKDYNQLIDNDFVTLCGNQPIEEPYFLSGINGLPSDSKFTTGCVLFILKFAENPMDALKMSVYLGGDVDSIASLTTGILAGIHGLRSLPSYMLDNVEGLEYLKRISFSLEHYLKGINEVVE